MPLSVFLVVITSRDERILEKPLPSSYSIPRIDANGPLKFQTHGVLPAAHVVLFWGFLAISDLIDREKVPF